jgi:hypothetical protein
MSSSQEARATTWSGERVRLQSFVDTRMDDPTARDAYDAQRLFSMAPQQLPRRPVAEAAGVTVHLPTTSAAIVSPAAVTVASLQLLLTVPSVRTRIFYDLLLTDIKRPRGF